MQVLRRAILLVVLIRAWGGCDYLDKKTTIGPESPASSKAQPAAPIPVDQVELFDTVMQHSDERMLTGDLRPVWIVSGRIRNNSMEYLGELHLRIHITPRGSTDEVLDEANLVIETDISPGSAESVSRKIQILPPQKAWEWTYEVVDARTEK
jgi:hypothetical protein